MARFSSVSVLGCGWLGFPLASRLVEAGWAVKGSTTSPQKLEKLQAAGIEPLLVQFPIGKIDVGVQSFFKSEILIVNIPPRGDADAFVKTVSLIAELAAGNVRHVLFISSTSVYADNNSVVTESNEPSPNTASAQAMLAAENILKSNGAFKTTIIRFAGLVGPGRHPGRFLAGKKDVPNGLAPINLIHLDDCIGIVLAILSRKAFGHTFNACSPGHPTREEFYTKAAQSLGLEPPEFITEKRNYKIVGSNNVPPILNYQYKISDWLKWLT